MRHKWKYVKFRFKIGSKLGNYKNAGCMDRCIHNKKKNFVR